MGDDDEFQIPETTEFTVDNLHLLDSGFDVWDDETEVGQEVLAWAASLTLPNSVEGVDHGIDHYEHGEAMA